MAIGGRGAGGTATGRTSAYGLVREDAQRRARAAPTDGGEGCGGGGDCTRALRFRRGAVDASQPRFRSADSDAPWRFRGDRGAAVVRAGRQPNRVFVEWGGPAELRRVCEDDWPGWAA